RNGPDTGPDLSPQCAEELPGVQDRVLRILPDLPLPGRPVVARRLMSCPASDSRPGRCAAPARSPDLTDRTADIGPFAQFALPRALLAPTPPLPVRLLALRL